MFVHILQSLHQIYVLALKPLLLPSPILLLLTHTPPLSTTYPPQILQTAFVLTAKTPHHLLQLLDLLGQSYHAGDLCDFAPLQGHLLK